jgi:hypothetical protein
VSVGRVRGGMGGVEGPSGASGVFLAGVRQADGGRVWLPVEPMR